MKNPKEYAKATASGAIALASGLTLVVTGNDTFADITLAEWLLVIVFTGGAFGITYQVPNREPVNNSL